MLNVHPTTSTRDIWCNTFSVNFIKLQSNTHVVGNTIIN